MAALLLFKLSPARHAAVIRRCHDAGVKREEDDMEATPEVQNAILRIQTEYVEMPDMKLTPRQAQRLWNFSQEVWEAALAELIGKQFLVQTRDGAYVRYNSMAARIVAIESLLRAS